MYELANLVMNFGIMGAEKQTNCYLDMHQESTIGAVEEAEGKIFIYLYLFLCEELEYLPFYHFCMGFPCLLA